ncbi:GNAT family N-acetyltransferase [Actinospica sp.]|uniref:GNAT family N-acetyltransferase n=1 Tax=Actinospica sp. TaxID=1872142 RepID=UPI002D1D1554|nr:GNAT family N-acetyltransferase [Actinospica sp.]HWG27765.1 GNAT family N-acetyltransferase [Actinospica sp.]
MTLEVRAAVADDAEQIALLHTDSWRRFYRDAFSDSYLDGDVLSDRRTVWSTRLAAPSHAATIVAADGSGVTAFVHVILDEDARWGSLIDNLHVRHDQRRSGLGRVLVRRAAAAVAERAADRRMYLWVLEQNANAQRFYQAMGGACVEKTLVDPPGGVPDRLAGTPSKLRIAWADVAVPELRAE